MKKPGLVEYALILVLAAVSFIVSLALAWDYLPNWPTIVEWGYAKSFLSIPNWMLVFGGLLATCFILFGITQKKE